MFKPSTHVAIPEDGYEKTDVKAKIIVISTAISVVLTLVSIFIAFLQTIFLISSDARDYTPKGTYQGVAAQDSDWTNPAYLQAAPAMDLKNHKHDSAAKSASFGKLNESAEVYHIPVDDALNLVADAGVLPTIKATEVAE